MAKKRKEVAQSTKLAKRGKVAKTKAAARTSRKAGGGKARKVAKRKISRKSKRASKSTKKERAVTDTPVGGNRSLGRARLAKEDEFYTQLPDIERELRHYKQHFKDKVVYLNCDDPRVSNFFHYFSHNFETLGLKKVIATCYKSQSMDLFSQNDSEQAIWLEYTGDRDGNRVPDPSEIDVKPLRGDGDFRSDETIELLKQADIVVTNPPFSLFREYVAQLIEHEKKFIIIGNQNAITYKEIFPLIKDGRLWLGHLNGDMKFRVPDYYEARETRFWVDEHAKKWRSLGNACWFTNLDIAKRHENLVFYKQYSPEEYPKYDNFDAIEVSKFADIPADYNGVMGVPITFLNKHNPDQFEIVGITKTWFGGASKIYPRQIQVDKSGKKSEVTKLNDGPVLKIDKKPKNATYYMVDGEMFMQAYARILIRKKGAK